MIQENELRVGNYLYDGVGGIIKVEVDDLYDNVRKYYEPIPIMEEILLKCGFEKSYTKGVFRLGDWTIDLYSKTWKFKREWIDINFKYLHQLQNLYFALTNQELEIKL